MPHVRMTQRGKWVDEQAQRYLAYKAVVAQYAALAARGKRIEKPKGATLFVRFYCHARKADGSNLLKAVEDSCNKIVWYDDKQVIRGTWDIIDGVPAGEERAEVEIEEVPL